MGAEFDRRERVHAMMERAGLVSPRPKTDVCDTPAEGVNGATAPPYKATRFICPRRGLLYYEYYGARDNRRGDSETLRRRIQLQ